MSVDHVTGAEQADDDSVGYGRPMTEQLAPATEPADPSEQAGPAERTLFGSTAPSVASVSDSRPVELGVTFVPAVNGQVTGVRFYKGPGNTGTHTGTLWTASGQVIKTAAFQAETASGWQTLTFDVPVTILPNTEYVVSYHAPTGRYAVTGNAFNSAALHNPPLHVPMTGAMYTYGAGGVFPGDSSNLKITTPEDLELARALVGLRTGGRTA